MFLAIARFLKLNLSGKVEWFNRKKGFGFITMDNKTSVFVHCSNIKTRGYQYLKPNQKVNFKVSKTDRGLQAVDVQVESKAR
ncbi:cold-shock protein [Pleionea mediterranea]|jgi:CspA family cold shock protein|uniref:CspA family cold shock protein n=1 Tax=Pleionea mediterranea TaxID=523701 RepID=A0A316FT80_9GAMM|nr:cold shock domain-containing protein [Pleionea mediterranea]PWK51789.1 CspA family cold shock protein [Pleionea mediterranea]